MNLSQQHCIDKKGAREKLKTLVHKIAKPMRWASLIVLIVTWFGCGSGTKQQKQTDTATASNNVVPVEIAIARRQDLSVTKTYTGTLAGEEQANIVAKISERITGIQIHVGEAVRAGQVTLLLDKSGASSQYYQAEANFINSEKNLERMKSLYAEGAISQQTLDGIQTAYDVAKANFNAARSAVELTTPIAGVVTALNVNIGDLATPGAVLATIAKINQLKVTFNLNETDMPNLSIGQAVQVYTESRTEIVVEGKIVQVSKSADVRSRTFEIKALLPNTPDTWFKPGMFCKVNVQVSPRSMTLVIPTAAIQSDGLTNRVFVVRQGRTYQQPVQVGISDGNYSEIVQGIGERDTVVTTGATNVRDSSYVRIIN